MKNNSKQESAQNINPLYRFRFSAEQVFQKYSSAEDAFDAGDYMSAAQICQQHSQIHGCALIMSGLVQRGVNILNNFESLEPVAQLCYAYGLWMLGRNVDAIEVLDLLIKNKENWDQEAGKFKELVLAEEIPIFITSIMVPVVTDYETSILNSSNRYGSFVVHHVGSPAPENAYDLQLFGGKLASLIDTLPMEKKPKLIFSMTPQWVIPLDLDKVSVPNVLWCHDSDHFLYQAFDNFRLYDLTIVNNSQEHYELTEALSINCVSNFVLSPMCSPFPEYGSYEKKEIGVFISGSTINSPHSDKSKFIFQLSQITDKIIPNTVIIDGYLDEKLYHSLLSKSHYSVVLNRYLGCPSPRWRETLSAGSSLFYPRGGFYQQITSNAFPYNELSIPEDISQGFHTNHTNFFEKKSPEFFDTLELSEFEIYRGSQENNIELMLKYAVFTALILRPNKKQELPKSKPRSVWLTPHIDHAMFGIDNVYNKIVNYANLSSFSILDSTSDEKDYSNVAKLYVQLALLKPDSKLAARWRSIAKEIIISGIERYPRSLLLRFNQAYWGFIDNTVHLDLEYIVELFNFIIANFDSLEFDPLGSDIGLGIYMIGRDKVFPYVEYGREMVMYAVLNNSIHSKNKFIQHSPRKLILSLCHAYIGWIRLLQGNNYAALERFRIALNIFRHNEILIQTSLKSLIDYLEMYPYLINENVNELTDLYFDCINLTPEILITENTVKVIALLNRAGRYSEVKYILEKWSQLMNIIYLPDNDHRLFGRLEIIQSLMTYREHFPDCLIMHIENSISKPRNSLTFFEEMIYIIIIENQNHLKFAMINRLRKLKIVGWFYRALKKYLKPVLTPYIKTRLLRRLSFIFNMIIPNMTPLHKRKFVHNAWIE